MEGDAVVDMESGGCVLWDWRMLEIVWWRCGEERERCSSFNARYILLIIVFYCLFNLLFYYVLTHANIATSPYLY